MTFRKLETVERPGLSVVIAASRGDALFQPLTKQQAMLAQHATILYHRTRRNSDGTALRARTNGRCKVWATRPDEFRLPMKHGMYEAFYITEHNADNWSLVEPKYAERRGVAA